MSSIQVIKYRDTLNTDTGKRKFVQSLIITVKDIPTLFANIDEYVGKIAEGERYDIHYTLAQCFVESIPEGIPLRAFEHQEVIAFDIDKCDKNQEPRYTDILCNFLKIPKEEIGISCSGNGLHYLIYLDKSLWIYTQEKIEELKKYYKAVCGEINLNIFNAGLSGECDPVTMAVSKTLRLPNTTNPKTPPTQAYIINKNIKAQKLDISKLVTLEDIKEDKETLYKIDTPAVLTGCQFLGNCLSYPNKISEPEWFSMISVLSLIPSVGESLCQQYSKGHTNYSHSQTQHYYEKARNFGKPKTCDSINQVYGRCHECPYFNKVKSPLSIKGDDYIATEQTGFHKILTKDGIPVRHIPVYEDLTKYYERENKYIVNKQSRILFHYCGTHWVEASKLEIESFATNKFKPSATNAMRAEFYGLLTTKNLRDDSFFGASTQGYINFRNGVLNIAEGTLVPHSVDFGFRYCLPHEFNPHAKAPLFEKFMEDITMGDKELITAMLEFMAYSLAGIPASIGQKAMVLLGEGENGKSVFLDVIKAMVGEDCYSAVSIETINNPVSRYQLIGKLFNVSEEVPTNALTDSSSFKAISAGGTVEVKKLYHQPSNARIDCKLIFACNKLPQNHDYSHGNFRRLLLIPFNNSFTHAKGNRVEGYANHLISEMAGIYNIIISSYSDFKKRGRFIEPAQTADTLMEYKREDTVFQFVEHNITVTSTHKEIFTSSDDIWKAYNDWCLDNQVKNNETNSKFFRKITSYIGKDNQCRKRTGEDSIQTRGYVGIKLKKIGNQATF